MGFEDFLSAVGSPLSFAEVSARLLEEPHLSVDTELASCGEHTLFLYSDGASVFEIEVSAGPDGFGPCGILTTVYARFALCHPPAVDVAYAAFLQRLARRLTPAVVSIRENLPPGVTGDF